MHGSWTNFNTIANIHSYITSKISERTLRTRDMIRTDKKWVDIFFKNTL